MPKHKKNQPHPEGKTVISWIAPEYVRHEKSARWYYFAGIAALVTVIYAVFSGNWSMALAVLVYAGVYQYTHTYHPPKNIRINITEFGISVGHLFFPYSHIQAFWIIYKPGLKTLNLRVAGAFWSDIVIQLNDQDPVELRSYLVGQVHEWEGKDERLGELILRLLKL